MFAIKALINKGYRTQSRTDNLETQTILSSPVIERKQNKNKTKHKNKAKHNRKKRSATSHRKLGVNPYTRKVITVSIMRQPNKLQTPTNSNVLKYFVSHMHNICNLFSDSQPHTIDIY